MELSFGLTLLITAMVVILITIPFWLMANFHVENIHPFSFLYRFDRWFATHQYCAKCGKCLQHTTEITKSNRTTGQIKRIKHTLRCPNPEHSRYVWTKK